MSSIVVTDSELLVETAIKATLVCVPVDMFDSGVLGVRTPVVVCHLWV